MKQDLTNIADVQQIRKRAKYVATKRGYPQLADDFAGEVFVSFIEQPDRGATFDQLFIDYLRRTHGRPGTPGGDARIKAEQSFYPIDVARNVAASSEPERPDGNFIECFRGREAELYDLFFVEQVSEVEIAERYGVSASRICQLLKPIKQAIQRHAALDRIRERMEWDESFGVYAVEWITL